MKRYCKGIDIASDGHLAEALREFGKRGRRNRPEFRSFFAIPEQELFAKVRRMIAERRIEVEPIAYFDRAEPTNGKTRTIGREGPMQQYLDYVCVIALRELFEAKIGYHQCASIPGKGQRHARIYIERWVRNRSNRWWIKLDIRKYYPSVDRKVLFSMLERDVANESLVWLVEALVSTHGSGINIGSHLSQYLANYYLSGAYRMVTSLRRTRRSRNGSERSERLVSNVALYMDDWLLVGPDKARLKSAARKLSAYLRSDLHVEVKPWKVSSIDDEPIDMVGFVFRRDRTTVRPSIFLRARRTVIRANRTGGPAHPRQAARIVSYWGYFKPTATRRFCEENGVNRLVRRSRGVVSNLAKKEVSHGEGA